MKNNTTSNIVYTYEKFDKSLLKNHNFSNLYPKPFVDKCNEKIALEKLLENKM